LRISCGAYYGKNYCKKYFFHLLNYLLLII
jgi:hypothetical protein